jgi:hypothetical protein
VPELAPLPPHGSLVCAGHWQPGCGHDLRDGKVQFCAGWQVGYTVECGTLPLCIVSGKWGSPSIVVNSWQIFTAKSTKQIRPLAKKFARTEYPCITAIFKDFWPKSHKKVESIIVLNSSFLSKIKAFMSITHFKKSSATFRPFLK